MKTTKALGRTWSARACSWEFALFTLVLGARLAVFAYAGSPLPYYDQWLAEYNNLLLVAAAGHDIVPTLLLPHNDHLIITTKLLSLAGYVVNGYWDVEFLAVLSAFVRAGEAAFALRLLAGGSRTARAGIFAACLVTFAVPYSAYNQLCGLQVCFYLSELALLWSLRTVLRWSAGWHSGVQLLLSMLLGLLSLAAAVAIPVATLAAHLSARRPRDGFWIAWLASLALAFGFVLHSAAAGSGNAAGRIPEIARFFFAVLSWPILHPVAGVLLAAGMIVLFLHAARRPTTSTQAAAAFGIAAYAAANAFFIALNRSPEHLHLRHWEILALFPLAVVAAAIVLLPRFGRPKLIHLGILVTTAACLGFLAFRLQSQSIPYLQGAHRDRTRAIAHYRALLGSAELVAHGLEINDRLARRDYSFFDDPIARFAMHPVVTQNISTAPLPSLALLSPGLVPGRPQSAFSTITRAVKQTGPGLLLIGIGLLYLAMRRTTALPPVPPRSGSAG